MTKIYLVTLTETEVGMYLEHQTKTTKKAFTDRRKAVKYFDELFHKCCDDNDIEELGIYEQYTEGDSFHLQENANDVAFGDWEIDCEIEKLNLE